MTKTANRNVTPQEVENGSSDPEGNPISFNLSPAGPYPLGTTTVALTVTDDKGAASQCTANVTINRGTPIINWPNPADIVYGTPLGAEQLNATASFNGTEVPGSFTYTPAVGAVLNAGNAQSLSVSFTPDDSTLYTEATATAAIKVNQAPLVVTAQDQSKLYGAALPSFTATYAGLASGQDSGVLSGTLNFSTQATERSAAGSYAITPGGLTSSNYLITFVDGTLTIDRTALAVTADHQSKLYGAALPPFTASYSGFVLGEDQGVLGGLLNFSTTATVASDVGTYAIKAGGLTSPNYEITFVDGLLTVTPAPLTVKADDKTNLLGAPLPIFTASYSGFVLGQNQNVLSGSLTFTTAAATSSGVGNYAIAPGGLASSNYAITFLDGTLAITYNLCLLYDPSKAKKSGSTIPIKLKLCTVDGQNVSSPQTIVTALAVVLASNDAPGPLEDAGNATPDDNFRFTSFDGEGGYTLNLKTTGLATGTYNLLFKAANDSVIHIAPFQIR